MFACVGVKPGFSFGNAATNPLETGKSKQSQETQTNQNAADSSQVQSAETKDSQSTQETSNSQQSGGSSSGPPTALLSVLSSLGLSPSGSKESDYTNVMSHLDSLTEQAGTDISQKQHISNMRQTFLAVYSTL